MTHCATRLLWLLPLAACDGRRGDYHLAREVCGLADGEYHWQDRPPTRAEDGAITGHTLLYPLSLECSTWIGKDFGVEWAEWDSQPKAMGVDPTYDQFVEPDGLVADGHVILMLDLGTIEQEWQRDDRPPAFSADVERYLDRGLLAPTDNLAAAFYVWMTDKVRHTRMQSGNTFSSYDRHARTYYMGSGKEPTTSLGLFSTLPYASHEAGHAYAGHLEGPGNCPQFEGAHHHRPCDATVDGALGMAGFISHRIWRAGEELRLRAEERSETVEYWIFDGWNGGLMGGLQDTMLEACVFVTDLDHQDWCFEADFLEAVSEHAYYDDFTERIDL